MSTLKEKAISGMEIVRKALESSKSNFVTVSGEQISRESAEYLYEQLKVLKSNEENFDAKAIPIKLLSADRFWRSIQIEINDFER